MSISKMTTVRVGEEMPWSKFDAHPELYHREIFNAAEADSLGVQTNSILWEKLGVGGGVLPHYHNAAEIIHITVGKVKLLCNGEWKSYKTGDTFLVPAEVVHSVMNDDSIPTEQISIFLPVSTTNPPNEFFKTVRVDVPLPKAVENNV